MITVHIVMLYQTLFFTFFQSKDQSKLFDVMFKSLEEEPHVRH